MRQLYSRHRQKLRRRMRWMERLYLPADQTQTLQCWRQKWTQSHLHPFLLNYSEQMLRRKMPVFQILQVRWFQTHHRQGLRRWSVWVQHQIHQCSHRKQYFLRNFEWAYSEHQTRMYLEKSYQQFQNFQTPAVITWQWSASHRKNNEYQFTHLIRGSAKRIRSK